MLVFLSHLAQQGLHVIPGISFQGAGKPGVYLFFVLSALLLTSYFLNDRHNGNPLGWKTLSTYFTRRFLRIYPLYCCCLGFYLAINLAGYGHLTIPMTPDEILGHLLLKQGNEVLWSIPPEFKFYIALPLVVFSWQILRVLHEWAGLLMLVVLFAISPLLWPADTFGPNSVATTRYSQVFLAGVFLACLFGSQYRPTFRNRTLVANLIGLTALLAIFISFPQVWNLITGREVSTGHFHREYWFYAIAWGLVLLANSHRSSLLHRVFALPALGILGKISFSVYLLHTTVIRTLDAMLGDLPAPLLIVLIITATFILSYLSYRLIERPMYHLAHQGNAK